MRTRHWLAHLLKERRKLFPAARKIFAAGGGDGKNQALPNGRTAQAHVAQRLGAAS